MTASEYFEMPVGPPYSQLVHGELVASASPDLRHQRVLGRIVCRIANFLDDHPLGEIIIGPSDVQLGECDVYQPDAYYMSQERLGILDEQGAKGAPDLVVEVLAPRTVQLDRQEKYKKYKSVGVREIWFVNPWHDQIEVHRLAEGMPAVVNTLGVEDELSTPLLPGLEISVKRILA